MIISVGGHPADDPSPAEVVDLRGYLLLPSLVEPHAHLTLPYTGRMSVQRTDGGGWVAAGSELAPTDIAARIRAGAARYLTNGTTAIRVHVDVGNKAGPWAVEALLDARSSLAGILDIQIVAAISAPVSGLAGAANRAPLRHALAAGADLAGAGPGLVDEIGGTVENLAVMAADAGAGLDVHIDETAGSVLAALPRLIAITEAGFGYPVTVSHVTTLGTKTKQRRHATQSLADAGIGVVILPRSSPFQHRGGDGGAPPGQAIMRDLLKAGVPVAAGGDSLYEPSDPMGHADPLGIASHLVAARLTPAEAIAAISSAGRQIMRLPGIALGPGSPADLVAIRARDLVSAVTSGTADRIVLRGGQVVARNVVADLARPELADARSAWNLPRLIRRAYLGEQSLQRVPQVGNRGFRRRTVANCPDARAQLRGGTPDTILVLLDGVRHMDYTGHNADSPIPSAVRIDALIFLAHTEESPTRSRRWVASSRSGQPGPLDGRT